MGKSEVVSRVMVCEAEGRGAVRGLRDRMIFVCAMQAWRRCRVEPRLRMKKKVEREVP